MKKIFAVMGLMAAVMLTACANIPEYEEEYVTEQTEEREYPAMTDPVGCVGGGFSDIATEDEDYGNIVCRTELETYSPDTEYIDITIENQNAGKGFWFYVIPHLERLENGEWVRLNYYDIYYRNGIAERWWYCAVENRPDMNFSTRIRLDAQYCPDGAFTPGEYRAVVYVGNEKIYAPFAVTE